MATLRLHKFMVTFEYTTGDRGQLYVYVATPKAAREAVLCDNPSVRILQVVKL